MDYKNTLYRVISSLFLLLVLYIFVTQYINYLNIIIYFIYIVIFFEIIFNFKKFNFIFLFILFYILISFICLKYYFDYFFNIKILLYTIAIIIIFDSSSYIFGSNFGKLKMFPKISPNKTFFGFFAGLFITIIFSFLLNYLFNIIDQKIVIYFIALITASSFLGDLLESIFKRNLGIKNSSTLIPGHGGFFDRFDSFLMSINTLFLYSYFFEFYVNN